MDIKRKVIITVPHTFLRFLLVGMINTVIGVGTTFFFLHLFHWNYWWSTFIGNSIGVVVSFFLNRSFTFQDTGDISRSFPRFLLVTLLSYFLAYGLGLLLAERVIALLPIPGSWIESGAVLIGAGLYTILNYTGHRLFTFPRVKKSLHQ
ncbi:GtrA family protein [[Clostridium] ultunense Esp]|nr:GtrA family protein [Thermicanus sp.]CCQ95681.1 GtrA family protein [[Clostridium] ultunense Esp]